MAQPLPGSNIRVRLITMHECALCDHARLVLTRLQTEYPLVVEEVAGDSAEGRHLVDQHRIPFLPALFLGDEYAGYGRVSERRLRAQLDGQQ